MYVPALSASNVCDESPGSMIPLENPPESVVPLWFAAAEVKG